ncbi:hypothetical protein [Rubripirellula reticaptiva]|uniref:Uncharacterized protein n=1 Tax=Rubripirellula reticaptiva TaxID=2528013 RepID=A0A5C6EU67_9BACT|nr:hypothetical protein [Rubripirellula reticaptiva]TWU51840.1 hypothetical protein Poly59_34350 [Rubripirellula reticaptiva]
MAHVERFKIRIAMTNNGGYSTTDSALIILTENANFGARMIERFKPITAVVNADVIEVIVRPERDARSAKLRPPTATAFSIDSGAEDFRRMGSSS